MRRQHFSVLKDMYQKRMADSETSQRSLLTGHQLVTKFILVFDRRVFNQRM